MVKHKKSPVTLDFDTAVASVPDTNSIKNLVGEAIDLQLHYSCRTTKQEEEEETLNNWKMLFHIIIIIIFTIKFLR